MSPDPFSLDFQYDEFRIVERGALHGVVALATATPSARIPCVRADGPRSVTIHAERQGGADERFEFRAVAPDLRGATFTWTINGGSPATATGSSVNVNFDVHDIRSGGHHTALIAVHADDLDGLSADASVSVGVTVPFFASPVRVH